MAREDAVKFGLIYNTGFCGTDPDQLIAVARRAEDCGFESFYVPEHITLYPGATIGVATFPPQTPIADPLECLAFVAAAIERILLGTGVLLVRATARAAGRERGRGRPGVHPLGIDRHDRIRRG